MLLLMAGLVYESAQRQEVEMRYKFATTTLEETTHAFYRCESTVEQCCK